MEQLSSCLNCGDSLPLDRVKRPLSASAKIIVALDRVIYSISRHWLFLVNSVFFIHVATLLLAPALVAKGQERLAEPIYAINGLFCHQDPARSFHLFGEKIACCQRCAAIYGSILLISMLFFFLRSRVRRPRVYEVGLLALPMAIDGFGQMIGLWSSNPVSRVITGAMFGLAVGWLLLPYLEQGFAHMRTQIESLFDRLVDEGRAKPLANAQRAPGKAA